MGKRSNGPLNFARVANIDWAYIYPERRCCAADCAELSNSGRIRGITNDRRSLHPGNDLFEEFNPFPTQIVFEIHKTGGVAAWPSQGLNDTGANRVGHTHKDDRDGVGNPL